MISSPSSRSHHHPLHSKQHYCYLKINTAKSKNGFCVQNINISAREKIKRKTKLLVEFGTEIFLRGGGGRGANLLSNYLKYLQRHVRTAFLCTCMYASFTYARHFCAPRCTPTLRTYYRGCRGKIFSFQFLCVCAVSKAVFFSLLPRTKILVCVKIEREREREKEREREREQC